MRSAANENLFITSRCINYCESIMEIELLCFHLLPSSISVGGGDKARKELHSLTFIHMYTFHPRGIIFINRNHLENFRF